MNLFKNFNIIVLKIVKLVQFTIMNNYIPVKPLISAKSMLTFS